MVGEVARTPRGLVATARAVAGKGRGAVSFPADRASLDARPVPGWYTDAKLGIFVHWGLYSIPGFAEADAGDFATYMRDLSAGRDTKGRVPYAEWYLNALRVPGSATARHHEATYGKDFSYFDLQARFDRDAERVDFADWAGLFAGAGARYVVMVTRHLDGYPLWPTTIANPHMPAGYRSRRDLVGDLTQAVRARGLRMGLYYGGGTDWTFTDKPIRTMADLMSQQALGPEYARYAAAQWTELIDSYRPSVLWNDVGWPAGSDPHQLMAHYYDTVDDGVVNDRWTQVQVPGNRLARALYLRYVTLALKAMARLGRQLPRPRPGFHYDVETHEYAVPDPAPGRPWELCRGLGRSFGYDARETAADTLSGAQLVHLLVDVVAHGGNLLVNVGPDGTGRIPEVQQEPLGGLGAWLEHNGEAIYATHPWTPSAATTSGGQQVRFTKRDATVYAVVLADRLPDSLTIRGLRLPAGSRVGLLHGPADLAWSQDEGDLQVTLPPQPPGRPAHVLRIVTA